jgi:hypothetical protein
MNGISIRCCWRVGERAVSLRSPAPALQPTVYLVFINHPDKHPASRTMRRRYAQ